MHTSVLSAQKIKSEIILVKLESRAHTMQLISTSIVSLCLLQSFTEIICFYSYKRCFCSFINSLTYSFIVFLLRCPSTLTKTSLLSILVLVSFNFCLKRKIGKKKNK